MIEVIGYSAFYLGIILLIIGAIGYTLRGIIRFLRS